MRKSLIVDTAQVMGIMDGSITMFYEPIKHQPDPKAKEVVPTDNWKGFHFASRFPFRNGYGSLLYEVIDLYKVAYPVGSKVYLREKWLQGYEMDDGIFKLDDGGELIDKVWYYAETPSLNWYDGNSDWPMERTPWKSASTMPKEAARTWIEITGVKCVRVQDALKTSEGYIKKYGQHSWDNNYYIFLYDFKKVDVQAG